jgi:glutathione synthase/RimK-type ligase-like ATP-grasp enzyme
VNKVEILIISSSLDFTTDYVCLELQKRGTNYLRLNRDEFELYNITLNIEDLTMVVEIKGELYNINNEVLNSIYYRAPIYLRDIYQPDIMPEEQLYRTQWTAFIRNLTLFDKINWLNNPEQTFKAENKLLQLRYAKKLDFLCPETLVTNSSNINVNNEKKYIVKSLDTALLRTEGKEAFVYSTVLSGKEIKESNLSLSPIVIQQYIFPKVDIRVTVIKDKLYAVKIVKNKEGIEGDWRLQKHDIEYIAIDLPTSIKEKCIKIVKMFGLTFGAIDLIKSNNQYYFIEVNPTGEWAWLVDTANLPIYESICDFLESYDRK